MAYNLEEQEQLDAIKAWWERYGRLVVIAIVGAIVAIGGVQGWRYYRATQATAAAALFDQLQRAERGNDAKKIREISAQIMQNYTSSGYAALAALAAARNDFDTGDLAAAKARLQWVIDNAADQETRDVARLRLARILFDDKKLEEALQQLAVKPVDSFSGLYADLRGDILATQGKKDDARTAYRSALEKSDPASPLQQILQLKLDALGEGK